MPTIFTKVFVLLNVFFFITVMSQSNSDQNSVCVQMSEPVSNPYSERQVSYEETEELPSTIEKFGYFFNEFGQLRHIETGEPFKFQAKDNDNDYNQRRYEALGELITEHVYQLLLSEGKLKKISIPVDATDTEPQTFIFLSEDAMTNSDRLVVFIHGSGVVRAGQWARKLIINDCINSGTQLPFIKRAQGLGYGVVVLNTNDNTRIADGKKVFIRGSESPEKHATYVWKEIIQKAAARHIAVVAHSYGGVVLMDLVKKFEKFFHDRVFAVALTDSVHSIRHQMVAQSSLRWLQKVACNWVSSPEPLDTPMRIRDSNDLPRVSAGHPSHEMTSWSSFTSIFEFLDNKYHQVALESPIEPKKLREEF
ncbi:cotranscriptional regulator ARB2A homolog isoform X2 [Tachypleus tridentatus]|uniref:cotranscriptional regulator ARB2A homolog isoform X2 n=1 Tax=Tachypleus tridentatus TaxID=6853 RepID=UPI003FCEF382